MRIHIPLEAVRPLGWALLLALAGAASLTAQTGISVDGVVESTSGGYRFPDGTLQTTAALASRPPAAVEDTGRATCFTTAGILRRCSSTGEDGESQAGVHWITPRFVDHSDGTVSDRMTGLMWLRDMDCVPRDDWQAALTWVGLTLNFSTAVSCDGYTAGTHQDWRLPNIKELESLIDYGACSPPMVANHPFVGTPNTQTFFWSSTTTALGKDLAWVLDLGQCGHNLTLDKDGALARIWAVRGGAVGTGAAP